jgi:hypothetical protein
MRDAGSGKGDTPGMRQVLIFTGFKQRDVTRLGYGRKES